MNFSGFAKERPAHAAALGQVVATAAKVEAVLGYILAILSGSSARVAIPMFQAVNSTIAQRDMLRAAGEVALKDSPLLDEFTALLNHFKPRYRERNTLVHNMWGWSIDHPDKALWIHVSDLGTIWTELAVLGSGGTFLPTPSRILRPCRLGWRATKTAATPFCASLRPRTFKQRSDPRFR